MISYYDVKSRGKRTGYWQRVCLFFFLGFFLGVFLYYTFQASFSDVLEDLTMSIDGWKENPQGTWLLVLKNIGKHGRWFLLMWLMALSERLLFTYQIVGLLYTGCRMGFLAVLFVMFRGFRGILLFFCSQIPQGFLLAGIYLFCFWWLRPGKRKKHPVTVYTVTAMLFLLSCYLEVKWNIPLMRSVL